MSPVPRTVLASKKGSLTAVFIVVCVVLTVILTINLKRQKEVLDRQATPMRIAWESVLEKGYLEKTLGLTFVRSSHAFLRRTDQFLYPRKYTAHGLSLNVDRLLGQHGVSVVDVRVEKSTGDVKFRLGPEHASFGELICTPDMSTYAGQICMIIDDFGYNLNEVVKSFLDLSFPLTFAVLPGHPYSAEVATLAHEAGYEVIVHMPMESKEGLPGEEEFILRRESGNPEAPA
ncbi:MAG: divergent polysaccharide deacetylase family protein [Fidelibacterota bacterium]